MRNPKDQGLYAWTVKVGERGQFVIPKEARDLFDIHPGDTLIVLGDINRGIAIPPKGTVQHIAQEMFTSPPTGQEEEE